jgi:RNA polymerase sigma factor (sigma-70 family)
MQHLLEHRDVYTDEAVIDRVLAGELSFFGVLMRRYNPVLYKIARSHGFGHHDAEDLMQDTHVSAYTELQKFEKRSTYKTWVSRIMINRCLYKLKYGYFKNEVPRAQLTESNVQPMPSKIRNNGTEETVAARELTTVLERSLQQIPLMYRIVFVLRVREEFSVAETAELLGISPINVKVRLSRAKALLQKQLEQFYTHAELYAFNLVYCDAIVQRVLDRIEEQRQDVRRSQ